MTSCPLHVCPDSDENFRLTSTYFQYPSYLMERAPLRAEFPANGVVTNRN